MVLLELGFIFSDLSLSYDVLRCESKSAKLIMKSNKDGLVWYGECSKRPFKYNDITPGKIRHSQGCNQHGGAGGWQSTSQHLISLNKDKLLKESFFCNGKVSFPQMYEEKRVTLSLLTLCLYLIGQQVKQQPIVVQDGFNSDDVTLLLLKIYGIPHTNIL